MPYTIGDNGDRVWVIAEDKEKIWRFSRVQAQAIHEALAPVCAGECACFQSGKRDERGIQAPRQKKCGK